MKTCICSIVDHGAIGDGKERLVIFEDGELLRSIEDPEFHAHYERKG